MADTFERRRDLVVDGLRDIGLDVLTPEGAFYVMPEVPEGFVDECIDRGVVLVPGEAFGSAGEGYARISYATSVEELEEALDRMAAAYEAVQQPRGRCARAPAWSRVAFGAGVLAEHGQRKSYRPPPINVSDNRRNYNN
jgi:hypothetical protein